ncbi:MULTISPECIES: Lrp/AsnC family transcriptional regulator [Paracoccus]|uniref:Winged helix-turn-helix transcriptional regulator n=1 Tax=Paracoccus litorisediminis TaxID=2006130 RepID=A0A844HHK7_9RHOB|nr:MULTISPECIES: Lrp/AsnC family transcriptional regulator [Paracoccus]MBD9527134.1 Lrp/AsnC family transcriptional regulator [Paracoccus sp. PAR01]MTH59380.1 winged helix-turn-helix transcriptional regulator [Paracoccus litorisediminis]
MTQIDSIDRKIIAELQQDGGLSSQELADRVGSSAASCWRRVKALEQAGILKQTVRLVDPARLGRGLDVFCQIRLKSQSRTQRAAFEAFIEAQENVVECYSISGDWDYLLHVVAEDVADYERVLMHGILDHEVIASSSSIFVLRRVKHQTAIPV